ncbi:MAG: MBL fold metallo-hydrolase [Sphingobacteriales bacterium]|nr:MBL fold metallo-hydrolase [Sphingobacteriales bacterium]
MSLHITSLNSGSNGNCYYIGNHTDAVLIDAGISCRETERRIKRLGLNIKNIKAIFISHEHSDHISGLTVLSKKYQLPVYITAATYKSGGLNLEKHLINPFTEDKPVNIGTLTITPFQKIHDAVHPHSFTIANGKVTVGVFTDIGLPCQKLMHHFKQCHAAFLEANYDEAMLHYGNYPVYLKKRISGGEGHLSNAQALDVFIQHRPKFLSHLILSHLSKNNNSPEIVEQLFRQHAGKTEIIVASRYKETNVFEININAHSSKQRIKAITQQQLSLF